LGLRAGLAETGYVERVALEFRWAEWQYDRLPTLAADLVRRGVALEGRDVRSGQVRAT
jgi:putative ABC transport system substrate-binding protein